MKKQIKAVIILTFIVVMALICINLPYINNTNNIVTSNMSFFITVIFSMITYLSLANYSKGIAISVVILLFFIYSLFAYSLIESKASFTRSAIILSQASVLIFAYISSMITKQKTTDKIKKVISKYVANQVLETIDTATVGSRVGTKEVLTIMFIDIRGFTTISENHTAEKVTEILNTYFKEIIPVIAKHKGVVNKFMGDALLAVFRGETPEIHARNAVMAGKAILKKLRNFRFIQESMGKEKITAGIGINTGEVFAGYIGTEDRCEYTVIGDTVNIASRTESANRIYKTEFLITENTYKLVKDIADVIKISDVKMKGRRDKVNVYEVLKVSSLEE